jgi:hypothetical protein
VDAGTVLDALILIVVALGGLVWLSVRAGVEQIGKEQAAEAAREINRAAELDRQLERIRGTQRQELRFTSYGRLWLEMRPLAIYDDSPIDQRTMDELSKKLSDWYFSETGGLLLTSHNRDLYFALQDLVSAVGSHADWEAVRIREPRTTFMAVLGRRELTGAQALMDHLRDTAIEEWAQSPAELRRLARRWRDDVDELTKGWAELDGREQFAVLQQVCSALRTGLTNDVESRLR